MADAPQKPPSHQERFVAHWNQLSARFGNQMTMFLTLDEVLAVVGQLQLALRHPGNANNQSARLARGVVNRILQAIHMHDPFVAQMLSRGDDPAYGARREETP